MRYLILLLQILVLSGCVACKMHLSGPPYPHLQTEGVDEFNPFSSKILCLYYTEDLLNI